MRMRLVVVARGSVGRAKWRLRDLGPGRSGGYAPGLRAGGGLSGARS